MHLDSNALITALLFLLCFLLLYYELLLMLFDYVYFLVELCRILLGTKCL